MLHRVLVLVVSARSWPLRRALPGRSSSGACAEGEERAQLADRALRGSR